MDEPTAAEGGLPPDAELCEGKVASSGGAQQEEGGEAPPPEAVLELRQGGFVLIGDNAELLSETTGWVTWDCSRIVARYLEDHLFAGDSVKTSAVLDLSSGNGVVAVVAALLGATRVGATEVADCLPLTRANVALNKERSPRMNEIECFEYFWGQKLPAALENFDLVVACDLLYIAIRDHLEEEFFGTLKQLCRASGAVLLAYEERVLEEERAFVQRLKDDEALHVTAVSEECLDYDLCKPSDSMGALMWEPPSILLFLLTIQ